MSHSQQQTPVSAPASLPACFPNLLSEEFCFLVALGLRKQFRLSSVEDCLIRNKSRQRAGIGSRFGNIVVEGNLSVCVW